MAGRNCTYPVGYWQEHPELYPSQMVIGGKVYRAKDIGGVFAQASQDTALQLQAQLSGAYLNFLAGADQSEIETTIFEAYGWLVRNPAGSELSESERQAGSKLTNLLLAYNQGLTGVPACEPELTLTLAASGTATETPTQVLTSTPSETPTPTPSETPMPTNYPTAPITTLIPSRTPVPMTSTPGQPTITPSKTFSPTATNTPESTTEVPPPTRTATLPLQPYHPHILQHLLYRHHLNEL